MEIRMLPLSMVFNTFPRSVRDLARQCGKDIQLIVSGEQTEMDKGMLQLISDPLTHLIRNAVDHGIESPDERIAAGKPARGTIRLQAEHRGNRVVIQVMDDGRGIDPDILRDVALQRQLLDEEEVDRLSASDLLDLIFQPGFSTAEMVTDVSGRGVGMDVVQTHVKQLKGTVSVSSEVGKGTTVTIELPLTLALIRALLVRVSGRTVALPTASVARTLWVPQGQIQSADGRDVIYTEGQTVPLSRLDVVLGWEADVRGPSSDGAWPTVILGPPERRTAFIVDELLNELEIVVKSLGSHLKKVPNVSGATILGNGDLVPILDVSEVVAVARTGVRAQRLTGPPPRTTRMLIAEGA